MSEQSPLARLLSRATATIIVLGGTATALAGCGSGSTAAHTPTDASSTTAAVKTAVASKPAGGSKARTTPSRAAPKASRGHAASNTSGAAKTATAAGGSAKTTSHPAAAKPKTSTAAVTPTSPAALTVGRASVNQVVLLHDLAVGATHLSNAPPGIGAPQAAQLARTFTGEARELASVQAAAVTSLASALSGYAGLAKQLATRPASDSARLPTMFVATLRSLDTKWRPAVTAIGQANHVKLLAGMAPLLLPATG